MRAWRGSVHNLNTRLRGALNVRVMTSSRSASPIPALFVAMPRSRMADLDAIAASLLLCFRKGPQIDQTGLEVFADHAIEVEKQAHDLMQIGARPVHRPGYVGRAALGLERELGDVVPLERLAEVELDRDPGRRRFGDFHASGANLAGVAVPLIDGALAADRTTDRALHRRILGLVG